MAITAQVLQRALRLDAPDADQAAEVARVLGVATEVARKYAPNAPDATADEAVIRVAGYLYDAGKADPALGVQDALRRSGAAALLAPYRVRRAGAIESAGGTTASGSTTAPSGNGGLSQDEVDARIRLLVANWAEAGNTDQLPTDKYDAGSGGGLDTDGVDARIASWARANRPTGTIPDNRVPASIARDSELPTNADIDSRVVDWARAGSTDDVPDNRLSDDLTRDSELPPKVAEIVFDDLQKVRFVATYRPGTRRVATDRRNVLSLSGTTLSLYFNSRHTGDSTNDVEHGRAESANYFVRDLAIVDQGFVGETERNLIFGIAIGNVVSWGKGTAGAGNISDIEWLTDAPAFSTSVIDPVFVLFVERHPATTLPDIPEDGHEYTLRGRDNLGSGGSDNPIHYWERAFEVPSTPGTQSGIGRALTVTGEGDRDVAWRDQHDETAREQAAAAQTAADAAQADVDDVRQLPPFPAAGSRDGKVPKYSGDVLGWEVEPGSADQTARDAAEAAQLDTDTVVIIGPNFTVGETAQRNLYVSFRHPLNAYSSANILSVSVQGATPNLQTYTPNTAHGEYTVGLTATEMGNLNSNRHLTLGNYVSVDVRLTAGRGGTVHFRRVVDVRVDAAPVVPTPTRSGPTYSILATDTTVGPNPSQNQRYEFTFDTAARTAFVNAWNNSTYDEFAILVTASAASTDFVYYYTLKRTPLPATINTSGPTTFAVQFHLGGTSAAASASQREGVLIYISGTAVTVRTVDAGRPWQTGSVCRIYGVNY